LTRQGATSVPHGPASMACFQVSIVWIALWRWSWPIFIGALRLYILRHSNIKGPTVIHYGRPPVYCLPCTPAKFLKAQRMAVPATMDPNNPLNDSYADAFNSNPWPTFNALGLGPFISEPSWTRFCMGFASFKVSYISGVCSNFLYLLRFSKNFPEYRQDSWYIKAAVRHPNLVTPSLTAKSSV